MKLQHSKRKSVLFLRSVPQDVKSLFKAACARREKTMTETVIEFMKNYIKEN
jgi:hypothetical protein